MRGLALTVAAFLTLLLSTKSVQSAQGDNSLVMAGFVTDDETHTAIEHVRVSASGDEATSPMYTDSSGIFRLALSNNVKSGSAIHIVFEKRGYLPVDKYVAATPAVPLVISMHKEAREKSTSTASRHENTSVVAPIEKLSELGWTIQPTDSDIQFEIANKPLPNMKESANYFAKLSKPFRLHFQQVPGITGLHFIAGLVGCKKIEIDAGEFSDISELTGFSHLTSLAIVQLPLNGASTVDLSPLSTMTDLKELSLGSTKSADLRPIRNLTRVTALNLNNSPARDIGALSNLPLLESLDLTGSSVTDLSPLAGAQMLRDLKIDGKQIADLGALANLKNLRTLNIFCQTIVDFSPVGRLSDLESLYIVGPPALDLSFMRGLSRLKELQLMGGIWNGPSIVSGVESVSEMKSLRTLTLIGLQISDLTFVSNLSQIETVGFSRMPISSLEPLRRLKSLKRVSLDGTLVVDIAPLLDLPDLRELSVIGSPARADVLTELERRGVKVRR